MFQWLNQKLPDQLSSVKTTLHRGRLAHLLQTGWWKNPSGMFLILKMSGRLKRVLNLFWKLLMGASHLNRAWCVPSCIAVRRSTHPTDTTWCPSSRPPTLSRTPHTTCPRQHAPSWVKSLNTVRWAACISGSPGSFTSCILRSPFLSLNVDFCLWCSVCGDQASASQTRFFRGKQSGPNSLSRPTSSQNTSRFPLNEFQHFFTPTLTESCTPQHFWKGISFCFV